ncbi:MAG: hypothetical protein K5682_02805 [Lachnospiraceae bacterium]|nr:hypothetical protein [Lachnospiraceae bacterium]
MNANEEVKMTYSGIVSMKGKPGMSVRFERGEDMAEGVLPGGEIIRSSGFSQEEKEALSAYLQEHQRELMAKAKEMSNIRNLFEDKNR